MRIGEYETHPAADLFPLLQGAEYRELVEDIRTNGQQEPIRLYDGRLLDGRNRLRACLELELQPQIEHMPVMGPDFPWAYAWAMNATRRHLDPGQRAVIRVLFDEAVESMEKAAAAARAKAAKQRNREPGGTFASGGNVATSGEKTRDKLAAAAGVSPRTMQKALTVVKQATPELVQAAAQGKVKLNAAIRQVHRQAARAVIEAEVESAIAFPSDVYRVIVADPPWDYEKRADDGSHRGALDYPSMSAEEILALPVPSLAHVDCVLWLWTTNAHLELAFRCLREWAFEYKTMLTWAKNKWGLGDWLRGQTEHCLLAVRGRPFVDGSQASTLLEAPVREHSRKPDEFYALIERICPGSKVELFARQSRPGWATWGAEKTKFDQGDSRDGQDL